MDFDEVAEYITDTMKEAFFGVSPKEQLRRTGNEIKASIRKLEREKANSVRKEQQLIVKIKAQAPKSNSIQDLKPLAQNIARTRKGTKQIDGLIFTMEGISQQLLSAETSTTINSVIMQASQALSMAGSLNDPRALAQTVRQFEMQKFRLEANQDMIDGMQEDETEDLDTDMLLGQLSEELDLKLSFELPQPKNKTGANIETKAIASKLETVQQQTELEDNDMSNLMQRFQRLKRDGSS